MQIEINEFELMYIRSLVKDNLGDTDIPPNNKELEEVITSKFTEWDNLYSDALNVYCPESDDELELLILNFLRKI